MFFLNLGKRLTFSGVKSFNTARIAFHFWLAVLGARSHKQSDKNERSERKILRFFIYYYINGYFNQLVNSSTRQLNYIFCLSLHHNHVFASATFWFPWRETRDEATHMFAVLLIILAKTFAKPRFLRQRKIKHVYYEKHNSPDADSQRRKHQCLTG